MSTHRLPAHRALLLPMPHGGTACAHQRCPQPNTHARAQTHDLSSCAPAGDFWERAAKPLEVLLERNNLTAADLAAVELLGGGSRVPRLKAELSKALGGRALDM